MRWDILDQGFVCQTSAVARGTDIAIGPRLAATPSGDVICSFMFSARTATNDFVPVLCRSRDGGRTWSDPQAVWPRLKTEWSIFVGLRRDVYSGRLFLYGTRCRIDVPGESNWSAQTQGLKANELIWSVSADEGRAWSEPTAIPLPIPGSAEAAGPLCVARNGRWLACYSPYNTFDPNLKVDRSQVVALFSDDQGRTWRHNSMLRFPSPDTNAAEAWLVELADGRLLGTAWVIPDDGTESENAYAISRDGGASWSATRGTGTLGQTTALCPLPDGGAVFLYNQRKHGDPGVRAAVVRPTEASFGIEFDDYLWKAETRTQSSSSGDLAEWSDFSFGEPSLVRLADGTFLAAIWCVQPSGSGIRSVKLRLEP
jgi:sialidase-1